MQTGPDRGGLWMLSRNPAAADFRANKTLPREHVTDGTECWCCPTVEPGVVIHHEPN